MIELPDPPKRIARLPKDSRGYPVPWFLAWMLNGGEVPAATPGAAPDFRVIKRRGREDAWERRKCWICGDPIGVHKVYAVGPMCVVNRVTMEPPSHRECAEYAAQACPFLARPRMRRLPMDDLGESHIAGEMLARNPGVCCLYEARDARPFDAGNGWLIQLGEPLRLDFWAHGRKATRDEVLDAMMGGLPELEKRAKLDGHAAEVELGRLTDRALKLLPAA